MIHAESLAFDFPSTGHIKFGTIVPEVFLVISSPDLMAAVQKQLQNHVAGTYNAQSVTIQLGDSEGALGSEMISENLSARLVQAINIIRNRARDADLEHSGAPKQPSTPAHVNLAPTAAGLRLYPKLPEVKGNKAETDRKVRELAIKYGAIHGDDGEARDMSKLAVTIKVNIFGFYKGAFYMNYRLIAPFRGKDKPEVLAEAKKGARKRAAPGTRKPRTASAAAEGEEPADGEAAAPAMGTPALKRAKPAAPGAPKKQKPSADAAAAKVNPADFDTEDDLAMAYVKAGVPLRTATQLALTHFADEGHEESAAVSFQAVSRSLSSAASGGAGKSAEEDDADE
jgi:hypothetical protein